MPILDIAQSFGLFIFVCLATAAALCGFAAALARLETAVVRVAPPAPRARHHRHRG